MAQTFTYDQVGNRTGVADSFGGLTTAAYDAADRLTLREMGGSGVTRVRVTFAYDAASNQTGETRQSWNGSAWASVGTTTQAFDAADRVTGIRHASGAGTQLWLGTYAYDAGDRMTGRWEDTSPTAYAYDNTDQLIKDGANATLTYDGTGNRTNAGYATTGGNRMTNDGVWTYTYDAAGQVTKRSKGAAAETWVYAYDHAGRLLTASKSATDGGAATDVLTYTLDAWGNRVQRQQSGTSTSTERYAVDGWDTALPGPRGTENFQAAFDLTSGNALSVRRVFGSGFDTPEGRQDGSGNVRWHLADHQGSVVRLSDNSGNPTATVSYDAFGKVLWASGDADRYGWTGTVVDALTGLVGDDARVYDPTTGRWLSEDPIGFDGGDVNLFRAVGNQVTTGRDPSGLEDPDKMDQIRRAYYNSAVQQHDVYGKKYAPQMGYEDPKTWKWVKWRTLNDQEKQDLWDKLGANFKGGARSHVPPDMEEKVRRERIAEVVAQVKALKAANIDPQAAVEAVRQLRRDYYLAKLNEKLVAAGKPPIASVADIDENANVRDLGIEAAILVMLKRQGAEGYKLLRKADRAGVGIELDTNDLNRFGTPWHDYKYEVDTDEGVVSAKNKILVYATIFSPRAAAAKVNPLLMVGDFCMRLGDPNAGAGIGDKAIGTLLAVRERTVGEAADNVYAALKGMSGEDWFTKILNGVGSLFTHDFEEGFKAAAATNPEFERDYEDYREVVEEWEAGNAFASAYMTQYYQRKLEEEATGALIGHVATVAEVFKASKGARRAAATDDQAVRWMKCDDLAKKVGMKTTDVSKIMGACFAAGTPLLTPNGSKAIEEFKPGDLVLSRDEHDPKAAIVPRVVEEVFLRLGQILAVRVGRQTIRTTDEHPFWVVGKGWLPAREVMAGDQLLSHGGTEVVVSEVVQTGEWEAVYNLRIADDHTYFVGCQEWGFSVWAHNTCQHVLDFLKQSGIEDPKVVADVMAALKAGDNGASLRALFPKGSTRPERIQRLAGLPEGHWEPPVGMNGPSDKKGAWTGDRLNSGWNDTRAEVQAIVKGEPIPFKEGMVSFDKWVKETVDIPGVKGGRANRNADTYLIYKWIYENKMGKTGYSHGSDSKSVLEWLAKQDNGFGGKGLTTHHAGGDKVQLVPSDLHKVQHTEVEAYIPPSQK